jgi:hypothetical protein
MRDASPRLVRISGDLRIELRQFNACHAPAIAAISVTPSAPSIAVSATDQLTAVAKDNNGSPISGVTFSWTSAATSVATVDPASGLSTGVAPGTAQITATANGVASAFMLTVTPGFRPTGNLSAPRFLDTATLLDNGMVLIAGGVPQFNGTATASAELYNPATGTFTLTGSLSAPRQGHTAMLLNDGKVLIAGGADNDNNLLASAELYDPATGQFSPTGSMSAARADDAATLLQNGKVLVTGGQGVAGLLDSGTVLIVGGAGGTILTRAEIY